MKFSSLWVLAVSLMNVFGNPDIFLSFTSQHCRGLHVWTDSNWLFSVSKWIVLFCFLSFNWSEGHFLTLTAPQSLLLKQLLLIRVQSEALKKMEGWWRGYRGINDTNSFSSPPRPLFSFFLSYLDSAVSTPLHLQSDLCYSSLWFLCVQRRQDVSNWKGCDGAGGPSLGLGGPQR